MNSIKCGQSMRRSCRESLPKLQKVSYKFHRGSILLDSKDRRQPSQDIYSRVETHIYAKNKQISTRNKQE